MQHLTDFTEPQGVAWNLVGASKNFPMALDAAGRRLFIGMRSPAMLQIYDTDRGKLIDQLPIGDDVDDIFFDAERKQLYAVCGAGVVQMIRQEDRDHYNQQATVPTRPGARTGLWVPEWRRLFVAVPHRDGHEADIRVFAIAP